MKVRMWVSGGTTGLITYMRTDSTNVSASAQNEARQYISGKYGKDYLPAEPPQYKNAVCERAGSPRSHPPNLCDARA